MKILCSIATLYTVFITLHRGGNVTLQDEDGATPLMMAAKKPHNAIVKYIIRYLMDKLKNEHNPNESEELESFIVGQIKANTLNCI